MMTKPTVTFVTAFLDLSEDRSNDKSPEKCFNYFHNLAKSGINICVFVSQVYFDTVRELCKDLPNIHLMPTIELSDTWIYKTTQSVFDISLPEQRTSYHDTYNFLVLMNAKIEFINRAIQLNPLNTTHFAWIDFSICHVIHSQNTLERLHTYSNSLLRDNMMLLPGCWSRDLSNNNMHSIYNKVHWRFCGGFFIGDINSLNNFYNCYLLHYKTFLEENRRLVWEVNFWAWLENKEYWLPDVYAADHNDSIVHIPSDYLKTVASLTTIPPRFERCKLAIRSLLNQVDHIYLSVSKNYKRFGDVNLPDFSNESDFNGRVTIVESIDYGPATKYLGALSHIPDSVWVFFCDDDQEYSSDLLRNMKNNICLVGAYQNRYNIVKNGSGGIIHGYVGNMFHKSLLENLPSFDLPPCSRFIDDQWMSIYCFLNSITIFPTLIENYINIFKVLSGGYEQIGEESLASLGNRDSMVAELAKHFNIVFKPEGVITFNL
jgi:hypothetical protein